MGKLIEKVCIVCGQKIIGKYSNEKRKTCGNSICARIYYNKYQIEKQKLNPDLYNQRTKISNYKHKYEVMLHYGGNPPKCACCGETEYRFLTIDHINGGGHKHRESLKHNGGSIFLYYWLIKNNFPEGYQVLCMNCNFTKHHNKKLYCPVHHPELYTDLTLFSDWYIIKGYKIIK